MSLLTAQEDTQKWEPTHVQVTVLRGRGLRGKGKHGTSDVYAVIQLGKEKYSTCVLDKTTEPEWREECSFELQSGVLQQSSGPLPGNQLLLTVMHRALIGMDVFLGQTTIQLDQVFHESRGVKNRWYRLNSKTGKKEKERGDIQVTVEFTRNNLTASMYDLVMKDKGFSTFTKLKERMRGKRRSSDEDSSSVTLQSGYGSLCRMRHRLPSDGGGEEDYEDDEGGEVRRSKMRNFFLRGKLRKSSDTRSSTSLGSESSESSSRGGSLSPTAGISVVVSDLSNSPSNSSNLTTDNSPEHTANTSPKSSSLQCDFGEEAGDITIAVPRPTVCVNGSHVHEVQVLDWGSGKSENSSCPGLLQKSSPLSMSLQNLSPRTSSDPHTGPAGDGRRWSFDKPCVEEKAAIAAALEQSGPMVRKDDDEEEEMLATSSKSESGSQSRKQKKKLFSSGSGKSTGKVEDQPDSTPTGSEEKHKGWFGLEDSRNKVSPPVSPQRHSSSSPQSESLPTSPVSLSSLVSPELHTNPFCQSEATPPPFSPSNPFFSLFHPNPFHQEVLTPQSLNPTEPHSPFLSSVSSSVAQLFPESPSNLMDQTVTPAPPPGVSEEEELLNWSLFNPFMPPRNLEAEPEWDEDFKAFATGRLQVSEDQKNEKKCTNEDQPMPAIVQNTNKGHDTITLTNIDHIDAFAGLSETVPELFSSESHNLDKISQAPADVCGYSNTSIDESNDSGTSQLKGTSPDPGSSDLGSSATEDFLTFTQPQSPEPSVEEVVKFRTEEIISELQPELNMWSQSTDDQREENCTVFDKSPVNADIEMFLSPGGGNIFTSSPDTRQTPQDFASSILKVKSPDLSRKSSAVLFGGFGDTCPELENDSLLLQPQASNQSSSSFLQSLYVSVDSQKYQTCESSEFFMVSDSNTELHSVNSTLCGDPSDLQMPASDLRDSTMASKLSDSEKSVSAEAEDQMNFFKADFPSFQPFDSQVFTKSFTDSEKTYSPARTREDGVESQFVVLDKELSQSPQVFDELLLVPASVMDPSLIQEFSSAEPFYFESFSEEDPNNCQDISSAHSESPVSCLASFSPSLTSCSSLPTLFSYFHPVDPSLMSPPSMVDTAVLKPEEVKQQGVILQNSPHPVKPMATEEKRSEGRSVLEKLKSTISPGRSSQVLEQETNRKKCLTEGAGSYYHLTHSQLVALLLQREAELQQQKTEFGRQKVLLAKREAELRRLKPQVRDLEDYIDTLLVRIMEQKPTLLQVRSRIK